MNFIWVNGRTPSTQSACAVCSRPIGAAYLRHIETQLFIVTTIVTPQHALKFQGCVQSHNPNLTRV